MSQEEKTVRSSETPEAVHSALEAQQASGISPAAVASVRTLQDVEREINNVKVQYNRAMMDYADATSRHKAALAAWNEDPKNERLTDRLEEAKLIRDSSTGLVLCRFVYLHAQRLTSLDAELARLQASSAPEAHQASSSSTAIASGRTFQDLQRDIQKGKAQFDEANKEYRDAQLACEAARAALRKDPGNDLLTKRLAEAKSLWENCKDLMDAYAKGLSWSFAEFAGFLPPANASFEGKHSPLLVAVRETVELFRFIDERTGIVPGPAQPEKGASPNVITVYDALVRLKRSIEQHASRRKLAEAKYKHRKNQIDALVKDPANQTDQETNATYEAQLKDLRGQCAAFEAMEDALLGCYREALMNYDKTFTDHRLDNARRSLQAAYGIIQQSLSKQFGSQSSSDSCSTSSS